MLRAVPGLVLRQIIVPPNGAEVDTSRDASGGLNAVATIAVSLTVAACRPTMAREKQSTTNASILSCGHGVDKLSPPPN
jgi:hypothetical protein